jgi:NlpC/P60 family putative phage cell wall peptidase
MTTRAEIVEEARRWINTRWRHQACLRGVACDCLGLIVGVAKQCGIAEADAWRADPLCNGYGRQPDPNAVRTVCARYLDPVAVALPGDVLVMSFVREPQHFAILSCLEPRRMIHSYAQARRVVEHGVDELWRSRIVRAYSFRGIA